MSRIAVFLIFLTFLAPTCLYASAERADLEKGITDLRKGDYNEMITDLVKPTSEIARILKAVAQGELSQRMQLELDGRPLPVSSC